MDTQICLVDGMSGASLLQTNTLCLFVSVSVYTQKMKVRRQSVQAILRIKEYSNSLAECIQGKTGPN